MQVMYLVAWLCSDPTGGAYNTEESALRKKSYTKCCTYICARVKL